MAGIVITAELKDRVARARLAEILATLSDRRPLFQQIGERLQSSTKDRFRSESGPDGRPWVPLAPATIKARKKRGRAQISILRETGVLAGSIVTQASNDEVRIGSPVAYAAIHQLGGTISIPARQGTVYFGRKRKTGPRRFAKKKNKTSEAHVVAIPAYTITIPARPYLGLSIADEAAIVEEAEDWLSR
ncbi:Phage capsid and scaffold [Rhodovulum sp. P5]|uniref:phage virion morphogenesis protein n=1 Tax=Rhodovulum sp. P5 TaxID=1564506 RepID=UPI0009C373D2|nr:phage virion morphogenesis protein [Rhodovulum sp. P5]ARE40901.1 Phage capsid and scaffold [Rhodovulum sp. P5]